MIRSLCLAVLLTPLLAATLAAQEVGTGERVRLDTRSELRYEGVLGATRGDTLWLRAHDGVTIPLSWAEIQALYVRRPESRGQSAWKWAKRGFLVTAAFGIGWCLTDQKNCTADTRGSAHLGEGLAASGIWFGSLGLMYGALGGALFPGTRWVQIVRLPLPGS